MMDREKNRK